MPYPNEHACRLRDPGDFQKGSFRRVTRKHEGKEYAVIMGRLKGETTMTEQAYRYPKEIWTAAQARSHCKDHGGRFEAAAGRKDEAFQIRAQAKWQPQTFDEESRTVRVIAATENPVKVFDLERGFVDEILLMSGVKVPDGGRVPLLNSHNRLSVFDCLGSAYEFEAKDGRLEAVVSFDSTEDGRKAAVKVKEGHLTDFSVGYQVHESVWIPEGEKQTIGEKTLEGPLKVVTSWTVKELSLTPIGADEAAKARTKETETDDPGTDPDPKGKEEVKMNRKLFEVLVARGLSNEASAEEAWEFFRSLSEEDQAEAIREAAGGVKLPEVDLDKIRREAIEEDRKRQMEIREACRVAGFEERAEEFIEKGLSIDEVRAQLFDLMKLGWKKNEPVGAGRIDVEQDERDKIRAAAVDGLAVRAGISIEKPSPGYEEFRGKRLLRLAEECLQREGINTRRLSDREIARRALIAGSSSDFPYILSNTAGKVLRAAYEEYPSTYEAWVRIVDAPDFKEMTRLQLSEAPDLELVNENGEYKEGSFGEAKEAYRVYKYGRMFSISWEAIVNDDLGALTRIPRAFGAAARRKINDIVYGILTGNPDMSDGVALFHANHSNLASGGDLGAPSVDTLNAARQAMRTQTGLNGAILNIMPRFIIVPAALETTTEVVLRSAAYPDTSAAGAPGVINPFQNRLIPVVEARLDGDSATAWYLAASPDQIDTIEVAFLEGERAPYLEEQEGFEVDGRRYKVRIVFGAKAIDWRGLYKNPGA